MEYWSTAPSPNCTRAAGRDAREALRSRPRPRIRPRGVMEYWSVGVLRQFGIAPRVRGVGNALRDSRRYEDGDLTKLNGATESQLQMPYPLGYTPGYPDC